MTASELFNSCKLREAIDAQLTKVKSSPADNAARLFLFELFVFAGELDRARKQIDVLRYDDPRHQGAVEQFRFALEAEAKRRDVFAGKAKPKWLNAVPEHVEQRLAAVEAAAKNEPAQARHLIDTANGATPLIKGKLNGKAFEGLGDADERFGTILEVIGTGGTYAWVALESVETITMNPPKRPLDILYRPAHLSLRDGPSGDVLLPATYPNSHLSADDELRLAKATDWVDAYVSTGVGARQWITGDGNVAFGDILMLEVDE